MCVCRCWLAESHRMRRRGGVRDRSTKRRDDVGGFRWSRCIDRTATCMRMNDDVKGQGRCPKVTVGQCPAFHHQPSIRLRLRLRLPSVPTKHDPDFSIHTNSITATYNCFNVPILISLIHKSQLPAMSKYCFCLLRRDIFKSIACMPSESCSPPSSAS